MIGKPVVELMFAATDDYACVSVDCVSCGEGYVFGVSESGYNAWREGANVAIAFPELSAASREMFISGVCGVCWTNIMLETGG